MNTQVQIDEMSKETVRRAAPASPTRAKVLAVLEVLGVYGVIREKTGTLVAPGIAHGLPDAVGEALKLVLA